MIMKFNKSNPKILESPPRVYNRLQLILDSRSDRVSDAIFKLLLLWLSPSSWGTIYRIFFDIDLLALIGALHHFPVVYAESNRGESGGETTSYAL